MAHSSGIYKSLRKLCMLSAVLIVVLVLMFVCLRVNASAGEIVFFEATGDYCGDEPFTEEVVACPVPDAVEQTWLPLDTVCEMLPISCCFDGQWLSITNDDALAEGSLRATRTFKMDGTWSDMLCQSGQKLYICPQLVSTVLDEQGMNLRDDVVYFYRPAPNYSSSFIFCNDNDNFSEQINLALYALWKNARDGYHFVVTEIGEIRQDDIDSDYAYAVAYVWPGSDVCYIVKRNLPTLKLAAVLAHEAMHIAFYKDWVTSDTSSDYYADSETAARSYQASVYSTLTRAE